MRLKAVQQSDIFVADPDYVYDHVELTKDGVLVKFMFIADAVSLLEQGITIVDVEGYRSKPVFKSEFGKSVDSLEVAAAQDTINTQGNFDFKNSFKIFDIKADITTLIDNTDIRDLRSGIGRTFDYVEAIEEGSETVGIDEVVVGSPPLVKPLISLRSATLDLIAKTIDPSSFVGKFPIKSAQSAIATEKQQDEIRGTPDFTLTKEYETFKRATTKTVSAQSRYRRVTATSRFVPVKFDAIIPPADIEKEDVIYLVIRANLQNGKMFSRYVFQAPSLRDVITTPSASSINRYLKYVKTIARSPQTFNSRKSPQSLRGLVRRFRGEPANDTYYTEIDLDLHNGGIPGTRIERRVGTNSFYGGFAFSSRIYRNKSNDVDISLRNGSKQDSEDVKFQVSRKENSLIVKVTKLASDVSESILLRRNITRNEESFSHISTDASKSRSTDRSPQFVDDTCELGHSYEYAIGLVDRFGSLEVSETKHRYAFLQRQEGVKLRISNVSSKIEKSGGNTTRLISFTMVPTQSGKRTNSQFQVMKNNSIPTSSITDFIESPDEHDPIFYFEITRENIDTGEVELCGIFTEYEFVDDSAKIGTLLPLKPLKLNGSYKYNVRLGLESAAALITTQYAIAISRDGKKYPFHSYKFRKTDRLNNATPSDREVQGTFRPLFNLIDTGVESSVKVTGTKQSVAISSVEVTRNRGGFNVVKWQVTGNDDLIDHYRVYASADGIECLLGCTLRTKGDNVFFDSEMFDRVGLVKYRVAPVLLDFSETTSASDSIFTLRNEPDFIVERSE